MKWKARLIATGATAALLIAALCIWFDFTPVASLAETRPVAVVAAVSALALFVSIRKTGAGKTGIVFSAFALLGALGLYAFYETEEVRFPGHGGVELAGTLHVPRWSGPAHSAVVFIHGSGREVRGEFGWHAKLFARHGIAALIYDKRGAGDSSGETFEAGYSEYAKDAAAAIAFLRSRADIDSDCVGIFGHSEGGWVGSIVAGSLVPDVRFVIVTSTTPLSPAEQVLYETGASVAAAGFDAETVARAQDLQRRVLEYQRTGTADDRLAGELREAAVLPWFDHADLPPELYPISDYEWWQSVMDFQSVPHWRRVRAPVLAISGGRDRNSDVAMSQRVIAGALKSGGNEQFTARIFPEMEHGLIEWWLPGRIPPPRFPAGLADLLIEWTRTEAPCTQAE